MGPLLLLVTVSLLSACYGAAEGRVRLNSIRTVILREMHALPVNGSRGPEGSEDLAQLYQCISDLECSEGSYCHAPHRSHAYSRCRTCRRRKRRCHRDGMCCAGSRCSNNICVPDLGSFLSQAIPEADGGISPSSEKKGWRRRGRAGSKPPHARGQVGDPCLRSSDCGAALCCARHFWARICKPVLREGQVCTRHGRKGRGGLELFQRCPCGAGLSCHALPQPRPPSSSSSPPLPPPALASASSASLPRHSSPHTSLLLASSSSSSSASAAVKTRLHVCQRQ